MDYLCRHSALPFSPLVIFKVNLFKLYLSHVEETSTPQYFFCIIEKYQMYEFSLVERQSRQQCLKHAK